jgi:oligopeptide transport system substrate-binding protein
MNSNILNKKIKNLTFSVFLKFGSISFLIILLVGLTKCESSPEEKLNNDPLLKQDNSLPTLGGVIRIAENDCYNTLFPAEIEETVSFKVITQMHDGLVALNPKTLSVVPAIAKKWEVNDAQTTYTFQLHDNAYFHDDPCFSDGKGKKITSNDFLYTFNLLCGNLSSTGYNALNEKILGAADFHSGKTETISGIKIVNDSVFSIELIEPASSFVHLLASPLGSVISKDAFEAYGKELKVGAGPFIYGELNNDSSNLKLYKNNNYYQKDQFGNNLPYLDEISFTFESNEERREELFSTRKLDLLQGVSEIYLEKFFVENQKTFMSREFMVDRKDVLATDCYEFNNINEPFNDVRVRKAFNYAINKKKLIENILDNQGKIGLKGVVPNIKLFKNYNYDSISGYPYNPSKAAQLLSEAGYPNGKDFPEVLLELNIGNPTQLEVAKEVQSQLLMALNINITIEQIEMSTLINRAALGMSQMNHFTWVSEYPSPADFLNVFYSGNAPLDPKERAWPNTSRYKNKSFDKLLKQAISTTDEADRYDLFSQAEQILIDDAPVAVLWYPEIYNIYHSSVKNLSFNELYYYDFSSVYISK